MFCNVSEASYNSCKRNYMTTQKELYISLPKMFTSPSVTDVIGVYEINENKPLCGLNRSAAGQSQASIRSLDLHQG